MDGARVIFRATQQETLRGLIEKWEGIAAEATALAEDCPSRIAQHAMERKAAHYRACAEDLRSLAIKG